MNECFDVDELATLGGALRWDPHSGLEHLRNCSACSEQLLEVVALRDVLTMTEPVSERWIAQTAELIESEAAAPNVGVRHNLKERLELMILVGGTALAVLLPPVNDSSIGFSLPIAAVLSTLVAIAATSQVGPRCSQAPSHATSH